MKESVRENEGLSSSCSSWGPGRLERLLAGSDRGTRPLISVLVRLLLSTSQRQPCDQRGSPPTLWRRASSNRIHNVSTDDPMRRPVRRPRRLRAAPTTMNAGDERDLDEADRRRPAGDTGDDDDGGWQGARSVSHPGGTETRSLAATSKAVAGAGALSTDDSSDASSSSTESPLDNECNNARAGPVETALQLTDDDESPHDRHEGDGSSPSSTRASSPDATPSPTGSTAGTTLDSSSTTASPSSATSSDRSGTGRYRDDGMSWARREASPLQALPLHPPAEKTQRPLDDGS